MSGHVVSVRFYVAIFVTLLLLTGLTTGVAFINLGALNTVAAMVIAFTKMLLVVLFFMHLRYSSGLTKVILLAGFLWLALLMSLTLTDIFTRPWTPVPGGWSGPAAASQSQ